jgi:polyhydroxyalkanoate synthesis regulator phasin
MNPNDIFEFLQNGFRVTLGATTSFVEGIQDAQKREQITELAKTDFNQLLKDFANKGEITEQEARRFVETVILQQKTAGNSSSNIIVVNSVTSDIQDQLQDLTAEIASFRNDLEKLRNS